MNTAWTFGFLVGILAVAAVCALIWVITRKKAGLKKEYDERQQALRGRAFAVAYATILVYLGFWMVMNAMEIPFFMQRGSVMLGLLLSVVVFVGHCIFNDAYFRASESPRRWIVIFSAATLMNLAIGVWHLVDEDTIQERLLNNANLMVGVMLLAVLACLLIKRALDRRAAE